MAVEGIHRLLKETLNIAMNGNFNSYRKDLLLENYIIKRMQQIVFVIT